VGNRISVSRRSLAVLRCAYCHDELALDHVVCDACATPLHIVCAKESFRCPIYGCRGELTFHRTQSCIQPPRAQIVTVALAISVLAFFAGAPPSPPRSFDSVLLALQSGDSRERREAARELPVWGEWGRRQLPLLERVARADGDSSVRAAAARAIEVLSPK
jgi:hypothetical protein